MRKLIAILDSNTCTNKTFNIKWRLSDQCNYRCSYCLRAIHNDYRSIKQDEKKLCKTASDITKMLNNTEWIKKVKIDAIGGEPSILDLHKIFGYLVKNNTKIVNINMTTNLSQSVEYYVTLHKFLADNNIRLSITASYHPEFENMDNYFNKIVEIKKSIPTHDLNCETVSRIDNQDMVKEFYNRCIEGEHEYKIEKDVSAVINADLFVKSAIKNDHYYRYNKDSKTVDWSHEPLEGYTKIDGRYLLIFERGKPEVCKTRNEIFLRKDIYNIIQPNLFIPDDFYCTNSCKFINILYDKVTTCRRAQGTKMEDAAVPVAKFKLSSLEDAMCPQSGFGYCSICGSISLAKYTSFLE